MSEPADVKRGHLWVLMTKVVIPLAETPMDYVNQLKGIGGTPNRDYVDRKYLTYTNNHGTEEWRWNGRLWRWNGPCKIVTGNQNISKTYNISGGFRIESFNNRRLYSIVYQNMNGVTSRYGGPAEVYFYEDGSKSMEYWYFDGEYAEHNHPIQFYDDDEKEGEDAYFFEWDEEEAEGRPFFISYDEGWINVKKWRKNERIEEIRYRSDGTISDKTILMMNNMPIPSNREPYRIEYDKNGNPKREVYYLGRSEFREVDI